jgi:hypothetical protein
MCRYAFKLYKPHYVCFQCRKQFKRPPLEDVLDQRGRLDQLKQLRHAHSRPADRAEMERRTGTTLQALSAEYHALVSRCPQCGGSMADLGLDFKPPRSSATRVWERIQAAHRLGHHWHTCGCDGPGFVPATGPELIAYLNSRRKLFKANISRLERDDSRSPEQRSSELSDWTGRVRQLELELAQAKKVRPKSRSSQALQRTTVLPRYARSGARR